MRHMPSSTLVQQADLILPLPTLIGIEVVLFALIEYKRYEGFKKTGKVGRAAPRAVTRGNGKPMCCT